MGFLDRLPRNPFVQGSPDMGQQAEYRESDALSLDIDSANNAESAAAHAARLFDPMPGFDRPILPYEVARNAPDGEPPTEADTFFRKLSDVFRSPPYEYLGPYLVGGPSGTYPIISPLGTPGEWTLVAVTFTAAGVMIVTPTPTPAVPTATQVYNGPSVAGVPQTPAQIGYPLASAGAATVEVGSTWTPCSANDALYVVTLLGSGAAYAMITYRRLLSASGQPAQTIYG